MLSGGVKMTRRNLACLLYLALFSTSAVFGKLYEPNKAWSVTFEPQYRDDTLKVQLKVYDWWGSLQDTAVVAKGTTVPIVTDDCIGDTTKCRQWTLPTDINVAVRTPTGDSPHRIVIYLVETGQQVTTYSSPTETVKTSSCSNDADTYCCNNQEYTLAHTATTHKVYSMWTARPNATNPWDGTVVQNFRTMPLSASIKAGFYTTTAAWPNVFFNKNAANEDKKVTGLTEFAYEMDGATLLDPVNTLTSGYFLLLPTNDPTSAGFVVPKSAYPPPSLAPMDVETWKSCRALECGAALGSCAPKQPFTPYAEYTSATTGSMLATIFNNLGRPMKRTCKTSGTVSNQSFFTANLAVDALHLAQTVSCDYIGSVMFPSVFIPRQAIEAGATAPPPPPPAKPPPPSTTVPTSSPSPTVKAPPPSGSSTTAAPPAPTFTAGPVVVFVASLPTYTVSSFNTTAQTAYVKAVQKAAVGASKAPQVTLLNITAVAAGRRRRLSSLRKLQATTSSSASSTTTEGIEVDTIVRFAWPTDEVAAQALLASLQTPSKVFPTATYGDVSIDYANELNCVLSCGDHGQPAPYKTTDGSIGCQCQCDAGWTTAPNENFETFKACNVAVTAPGPGGSNDASVSSLLVAWRPPVPVPPPPAPLGQNDGSGGMTVGKWIGLVFGLMCIGVLIYLVFKFWAKIVTCCGCCFGPCTSKSEDTQDQDTEVVNFTTATKQTTAAKAGKHNTKGASTTAMTATAATTREVGEEDGDVESQAYHQNKKNHKGKKVGGGLKNKQKKAHKAVVQHKAGPLEQQAMQQ